jgi:hypothetical protein
MRRAVLLALVLCACGGYPPHRTASAWELQGDAPAGAARALELVGLSAPCALASTWGGVADFVPPAALEPDDGLVAWWPDDVPRIYVAASAGQPVSETATAHEGEHVAQLLCGGGPEHDADFYARVDAVNLELQAEGL